MAEGRPVRLLGVRFSQFIPFTMQMSLFENNAEKLGLYKAVDDIKDRFGDSSISKATTVNHQESNKNAIPNLKKKKSGDQLPPV